jgi:molecular chaperone HtpG
LFKKNQEMTMSAKTRKFKTEVKQLLDLMIHSLYSHKEIFLRELISNASDAIDKVRYESLTNGDILGNDTDFKITLIPNKEDGTITIRDNGIGMDMDGAADALGTIAHSGTKEFIKLLEENKDAKDNPELIGQFGVGFYSSFMVADKVTVISRKAGDDASVGVKWQSKADGSFTIDSCEKETRGTDVILHLKEDEKSYLEEWEIKEVVKKYSDYISYPVVMDVEKTTPAEEEGAEPTKEIVEETLNSMKALWLKDKSEITEDEYTEFYKHVSHDYTAPAETIHYRAEGTQEFTVLLYIPKVAPMNIYYPDFKIGPTLYVKRVQIMDSCEELVPKYLRFLKGIVDSSDLPLNVSREILQNNKLVEQMNKNITKKVLETIKKMKMTEFDKYLEFYAQFGKILKEGIHYDFSRKEEIADLLLFESTETEDGKYTTLADYINRMKADQNEIYYITGAARSEVEKSPYLEGLKDKGYEVLFMLDEIDDIIINGLGVFKEKNFKSILKGDINLEDSEKQEEAKKEYEGLLGVIKEELGDNVGDVRLSGRLKDSACCLVAGESDIDPNMEKILRQMGQDVPEGKRIFEINPDHELFGLMKGMKDENPELTKKFAKLLYDQALMLEGTKLADPSAFAAEITKLMVEVAKK